MSYLKTTDNNTFSETSVNIQYVYLLLQQVETYVNLCKLLTFNFCFLSSVILHKLSTTASSDQHNFGLIRHRNINNIIQYMKVKVTFFLNNIITPKFISETKAWF